MSVCVFLNDVFLFILNCQKKIDFKKQGYTKISRILHVYWDAYSYMYLQALYSFNVQLLRALYYDATTCYQRTLYMYMLYTCMCIMTPGLSTLSRKQCQNTTETRGATSEIFISNDRHIVKISGSHQIIMLRQSKNYLAATLIVGYRDIFF